MPGLPLVWLLSGPMSGLWLWELEVTGLLGPLRPGSLGWLSSLAKAAPGMGLAGSPLAATGQAAAKATSSRAWSRPIGPLVLGKSPLGPKRLA